MALGFTFVCLYALHFRGCCGFSRRGAPCDQARDAGHGRCQRGDQRDCERHIHCEELSPGRKHLSYLRCLEPYLLSGQYTTRVCAIARLSNAQCSGWYLRWHIDLRGWLKRSTRGGLYRRVVPLPHEPRSILLPDPHPFAILAEFPIRSPRRERAFALIDADPNVQQIEHRDV